MMISFPDFVLVLVLVLVVTVQTPRRLSRTGRCGSAARLNFEVSFIDKKIQINICQIGFEGLHIRCFTGGCWEHIPFPDWSWVQGILVADLIEGRRSDNIRTSILSGCSGPSSLQCFDHQTGAKAHPVPETLALAPQVSPGYISHTYQKEGTIKLGKFVPHSTPFLDFVGPISRTNPTLQCIFGANFPTTFLEPLQLERYSAHPWWFLQTPNIRKWVIFCGFDPYKGVILSSFSVLLCARFIYFSHDRRGSLCSTACGQLNIFKRQLFNFCPKL